MVKRRRKQHKGEGQEGGWTLNTVMRIHASQIANIHNARKLASKESHTGHVTCAKEQQIHNLQNEKYIVL